MFSGSFERLLSAARANDVNTGGITPLSNALQNETDAYFKTLQAGAAGAGRQQNPVMPIGAGFINQSIPGMNMGNELGVVTAQGQGDLIAYPGLGSRQGGFNIMNPFTYGNMNRAVEGTRAGDENIQYSDSPAGQIGEAANERNRLLKQLLEGS